MAAFEDKSDQLAEEGVRVVAASADPEAEAARFVRELGLGFPVGFGLPLEATARRLGAFMEPRRGILHATGFVLRPDATVLVASYSTGPIGRLDVEDVLRVVKVVKSRT